jgi:hypothetical protein
LDYWIIRISRTMTPMRRAAPFLSGLILPYAVPNAEHAMKDMEKHLEKLRSDAAECALISGLAADKEKRELFAKLSAHLTVLADEVERVLIAAKH